MVIPLVFPRPSSKSKFGGLSLLTEAFWRHDRTVFGKLPLNNGVDKPGRSSEMLAEANNLSLNTLSLMK